MKGVILVTGGAGLLGSALLAAAPAGIDLHATRRSAPVTGAEEHTVDLADPQAVAALERMRPDLIVHTAYDRRDGARNIEEASRAVAVAAAHSGAGLVHLSSDMVFDGEHGPYPEDARVDPVNAYGRWKAQAERDVRSLVPHAAIVRTSLITRADPPDPPSAWVADSLRRGEEITLFVDELRCPIRVDDLAAQVWELLALPPDERRGVWHLAGPEALSRYALGVLVALHQGLDPVGLTAAPSPVPREVRRGRERDRRPRDLRLRTDRANAALRTHARPISTLLAVQ